MAGSVRPYKLGNGQQRWRWMTDAGPKTWDAERQRYVRNQLSKQGYRRKLDAERAMAEVVHQVSIGIAPSAAERQITVAQWATTWLDSRAAIRPSTRNGYTVAIEGYIKPAIGQIPLMQLRPDHLDAMLALIRSGKIRPAYANRRRPDGHLSATSVRQIFMVLTTMLNAAVKRRLIPFSPAAGVELEPPEHHEASVLGPQEIAAFLAFTAEHDPRLVIAWRLAFSFGLRRGEICGLRWDDIDGDWLHVRQQRVGVGGEVITGPPKTAAGVRSLPLGIDPGFAGELREHRKRQLADRLAAGQAWTETGLIVAGEHGEPPHPSALSRSFTALVAASGLPPLVLHEARHTANSLWREAGIGTTERQAWMGHSSPQMTDVTYNHLRTEAHDRAAALAAAYRAANGLSAGSM
ncbi:MAG: site-specific integrase [Streptosporangiaceae bacterium]